MKDKIKEIDDQIESYYSAKSKVDNIRQQIAEERCPLKLGDVIQYKKNNKRYNGVVNEVIFVVKQMEFLGPIKGNEVGWGVCGTRILKSTGKPGDISFGVNEFEHFLKDDIWQGENLNFEERVDRFLNN
ncbi:hypothetical protein AB8899_18150 [Yersinia enterocolitica]|uniref:hypothetical protein n=1 Tax=Yersinia enterocolitica TaxID=630 RepID=UPI0005E18F58|nr:hypothetical protein [Yersinia enterocolitica]EKN3889860.1 hypothetical protein [Yersinia enterocolitica]EKN3955516.1 hypothetical protein [Yersinia enterocolitica]EKN3997048.1 hypothetical protein [Yersinia enterocolitica]EKN4892769.1 hypothetical protein [Yersinia enterocolitica]EKN5064950.1 hypothetical protein [Yersinia enterocolitica]